MTPVAKKKLIGAVIAAALAGAVYYGLIDQKQADSIRTQADQTLGTGPNAQQQPPATPQQQPQPPQQPAPQQPAPQQSPAATQNAPPSAPTPAPAPQNEAPPPQR